MNKENTDLEAEHDSLYAAAHAIDSGVPLPSTSGSDAANTDDNKASESDAANTDDNKASESDAANTDDNKASGSDAANTDDKQPTGDDPLEASGTDDASEDANKQNKKLSKYAQEKQRLDRSWKKHHEEKTAFRQQMEAERATLAKERAELAKQRSESQQQSRDSSTNDKFTAQDYEDAAQKFADEGDYEMERLAKEKAAELRKTAQQQTQSDQASNVSPEQQDKQFLQQWDENLNKVRENNPELDQPDSELAKATKQLLQQEPILSQYPDGIQKAVEIAKMRIAASTVPTLEKENQRLKQELERLNKLTALSATEPGSEQEGKKSFDGLSLEQQEAELRRAAAAADSML